MAAVAIQLSAILADFQLDDSQTKESLDQVIRKILFMHFHTFDGSGLFTHLGNQAYTRCAISLVTFMRYQI